MANPQPEPFVQFSKELFDALLLSPMPATHKEIVLAVIRRTYGDHGKKSAAVSVSLLVGMTGRAKGSISESLKELREAGVVILAAPPTFTQSAIYSLNKDYERWGKWSVSLAHYQFDVENSSGERTVRKEGGEQFATANGNSSAQRTIEDKRDKIEDTPPTPPRLKRPILDDFATFWDAYPKKADKGQAEKEWGRAMKATTLAVIMAALTAQLPELREDKERGYCKNPATWLSARAWENENGNGAVKIPIGKEGAFEDALKFFRTDMSKARAIVGEDDRLWMAVCQEAARRSHA